MCANHLKKINSLNSLQRNFDRYYCYPHITDEKTEEGVTGRPLEYWLVGKLASFKNSWELRLKVQAHTVSIWSQHGTETGGRELPIIRLIKKDYIKRKL